MQRPARYGPKSIPWRQFEMKPASMPTVAMTFSKSNRVGATVFGYIVNTPQECCKIAISR